VNREKQFFSFNKREDWEPGFSVNTELRDGVMTLKRETVFREKHRWNDTVFGKDSGSTAFAVDENGLVYFLNGRAFCLYDWMAGSKDELFHLRESWVPNVRFFDLTGGKAVFFWGNDPMTVLVQSVHSGRELYRRTLETDSEITAVCFSDSNDMLLLDSRMNLYRAPLSGIVSERLHCFEELQGESVLGIKAENGNCYIHTPTALYGFNSDFESILKIESVTCFDFVADHLIYGIQDGDDTVLYQAEKPVFRCSGEVRQLCADRYGRLYLLQPNGMTVCSLRSVFCQGSMQKPYTGVCYLPLMDSGEQETQWSRIQLDMECAAGTQVNVGAYAFDHHTIRWQDRIMGLEEFCLEPTVSPEERMHILDPLIQHDIVSSEDALLLGTSGQFLILRIELWGHEEKSPQIGKLRVHYNEDSFVQYLPEIYQTGESRDFLERFLKIMQSLYTDIEEKIGFLSNYIDIDMADEAFLRWLTGWVDFEIDETWSTEKVRALLKALPEIYRRRGTKNALKRMLALYLGQEPMIVENHEYTDNSLSAEFRAMMPTSPYGFTVIIHLDRKLTDRERASVKRILDRETPAYTHYRFVELDDWIALDKQSYLGINSYASDRLPLKLDGKSMLPYHSKLEDDERLE